MYRRKRFGATWCSALNCSNNSDQLEKRSFFRFPKNEAMSKKWVIASRRKDLLDKDAQYLYKNCKICSEHFETKMFLNDLKNRLHEHAVPTIFFESKSVLTPSQKKAAKKRPLSPCDEFYFQGSTNEQVLQPRIERVWIKSETAEQSIYKTSPEVKDEIDIEDCSDLSHQTNQAGADVCQQDSDSITLPEMVYIKEERVTEEEEVLCPENFMSFEMTVKEEIPEYLDSEKQQESSE